MNREYHVIIGAKIHSVWGHSFDNVVAHVHEWGRVFGIYHQMGCTKPRIRVARK